MATYATLTVNAEDIIGADFDRSRASVWVEANTEHGLIVVDGTSIRVGGRRENLVDGTATFELVTTDSADNPESFGYRVTIVYVPKGSRKQGHDTVTTSDFPLTADANLAAIPEAWDNVTIPPSWRSEFRDEMEALRDEATAIAAGDLTGTFATVVTPEKFGAVGNGTTDDTAALQAAHNSLHATKGGTIRLAPGKQYHFTNLAITKTHVTIEGPGELLNGTVKVGVQTGYAPVEMFFAITCPMRRTTRSYTVDAISIANSRHVDILVPEVTGYRALVSFPAIDIGAGVDQHSARIRVAGVRTPYWWDNGASIPPVDHLIRVEAITSTGRFGVGDITMSDCSALVGVSHVYARKLDGLMASGNTLFFPGYQRANATKTNHFDLDTVDWITITGNQLFEAGHESIRIVDPRNIAITANNMAWPGQRDLKDAIALVLSASDKYARGTIAGNNFQYFTKAAVAVYAAAGSEAGGLTIGPNNTVTANPNDFYYGATTLPTSFTRYYADSGMASLPRLADTVAGLGAAVTDNIGGTALESFTRLGNRSSITSRGKVVSVTAANTVVATCSGSNGSSTGYAGLVSITATNSGGTRLAHYVLSVSGSAATKQITVIASDGEDTGAAADAPSFTWTINASHQLLATPIASSTGSFTFYLTSLGNLRAV